MDVALVGPDFEENLSLRYLAAALRAAGHQPRLVRFNAAEDVDGAARAVRGLALVGLSLCFQARACEFLALARHLRRENPDVVLVAGGHFASCAAEEILHENPAIDAIVVHEGERTIVELADTGPTRPLAFASIAGLVYRRADGSLARTEPRPVERDLDRLPEPDRSGAVPLCAGIPTAYLLGSRGCVGACTYCCITTLHRLASGPAFRQRSTASVAAEMARLFHERAVRHFVFHDDNFLTPSPAANHRRLDALAAELASRHVRDIALTLKCRPCDLDAGVMAKLVAMGLVRVFLGVETATAAGLACLGRGHTLAQGERALALCDEHGVSGQFNILMFHPAATLATIRADLAFMRHHAHHPLNFCRAELYAGTPLERRMLAEGRAEGSYLGRSYALGDAAADRAWALAARVFHDRCWSTVSLMQLAIGLDHLAALSERCRRGHWARRFRREVGRWLVGVNTGMLALLERIVDLAEQLPATSDPALALAGAAAPLVAQEREERQALLADYCRLRQDLLRHSEAAGHRSAPSWLSFAAALALASGVSGCAGSLTLSRPPPPAPAPAALPAEPSADGGEVEPPVDYGICEYAPAPSPPVRAKPPSLSDAEVEDTWWGASSKFFDFFDQSKRPLPTRIQVQIRGHISPAGSLDNAELEDLTGALDAGLIGGLKHVFEAITFPVAPKGRTVNYKITFALAR